MTSLWQTALNNDFVCGHCPGNDSKCVVVEMCENSGSLVVAGYPKCR